VLWGAVGLSAQTAPPIPPVQSVTSLGIINQNPLIVGRDGTYSALIGGKSVWAFDDTAMSKANAQGNNFIDNSMAWTTNLDASSGITLNHDLLDSTGVPTNFLPFTTFETNYNYAHNSKHCTASPCGAEFALWPGQVVPDAATGNVYYFYEEIWRSPTITGWKTIGGGIAVQKSGKITRPNQNPDPTSMYPWLMWTGAATQFYSGSVQVGTTLYSYGCVAGFLVDNCQVASVPMADILTYSQWTYYAGNNTWSSNATSAVTIFQGGDAGNSVFWVPYLNEYMAVYGGVLNNNLSYRVSATPWGPWSNEALIEVTPQGPTSNVNYAMRAHPEFAQQNGQIQYITYVEDLPGFLQQQIPLVQVVFGLPPQ